jgi:hypothetical protein
VFHNVVNRLSKRCPHMNKYSKGTIKGAIKQHSNLKPYSASRVQDSYFTPNEILCCYLNNFIFYILIITFILTYNKKLTYKHSV